jgi:hypothetical protein
MDIYRIIQDLVEERNRVDRIIASLEEMAGSGKTSTSGTGRNHRGRKSMDAKGRKEVSERMKRYWANRRKEQPKT